ncbi:ABC transporter ATP-binding protein [Actinokineospora guangxiensis]|uniref:ABC transporter ATP-binding protein n=1 Tax=Actinokineospora guangxiensis TaxID=1490288 RepID=A0ABW0EGW6_9PSEU
MPDPFTPLPGSAETWRTPGGDDQRASGAAAMPRGLRPHLAGLRLRHDARRASAERYFAGSLRPDRGLPVADMRAVRAFFVGLARDRRGLLLALILLNGLAAAAALAVPRLLGAFVDIAGSGTGRAFAMLTAAVAAVVVAQAVLSFFAARTSVVFGQRLLTAAREQVVRTVLRLPMSKVESAGSGDLVTRVTRDVRAMSDAVRLAVPEVVIATVTIVLLVVAMVANSPVLALCFLVSSPALWWTIRNYLRRSQAAFITEGATYSTINTSLVETVEGARTVEAFGLQRRRQRIGDADIDTSAEAERYTRTIRNILFVALDLCFNVPLLLTVGVGAAAYSWGWVSLGQIAAAILYIQFVNQPLDRLISNIDRLQVGATSTARLLGIAAVPADRTPTGALPAGDEIECSGVRFAYRRGQDVLRDIDLRLRPGERLAIVGPSGSGKSTLGRLLAGILTPGAGSVRMGGVALVDLPHEVLREQVALVTQEHYVFSASVRANVALAGGGAGDSGVQDSGVQDSGVEDSTVIDALRAVGAWEWVAQLPAGLETEVGAGCEPLTPAQAQQLALARLIIANPHTLVLDEATSLIDANAARALERSMASLMTGRTVVAIAHRLHTAHDADRIAVLIEGRIVELGSHDQLLAADGEYARLWRTWTSAGAEAQSAGRQPVPEPGTEK